MAKILVVTELTSLNTGLSIFSRNLLSLLQKAGHEVLELGIGFTKEEVKADWPVVLNQPQNEHEQQAYDRHPNAINGQLKFDQVCLEFQPDIVFDGRDSFSWSYQSISPFRPLFKWVVSAAVDGLPQKRPWLELFRQADGVFPYTQFGKDILEKEGIEVNGIAPPSVSEHFRRKNKEELKESLDLADYKIVGTIMRNQPRKLIPLTLQGFRKYLDTTGDTKTLLYLATGDPDVGYDIPELIMQHGLSGKVLLTYICKNCNNVFSSFYRGMRSFCQNCKRPEVRTTSLSDGVGEDFISDIMNCFDGYIQLAGREGFGIPCQQAIACGIPTLVINYAGLTNFVDNYDVLSIEPDAFTYTAEMQMYDCVATPENVANGIERLLKEKEKEEISSSWEKDLSPIVEFINQLNFKADWKSTPDIKPIPQYREIQCSNYDYARYLVLEVLQKPELISSMMFTRLVDELNYGATYGKAHGSYLLETENIKRVAGFNREVAYNFMKEERERINHWERKRMEKINGS